MPQIPGVQTLPTVRSSGATGVFQNGGADPGAFGALEAQGLAQIARGLEQGSEVIAAHNQRFMQRQNEAEAEDVYSNQFSPAFREQYQKYYALSGKEALDKLPEFTAAMQDLRAESRAKLSNDESRRLFDHISRRRVEMELDGMARFADQQNKAWQLEVYNSGLNVLRDQAGDKYNDEVVFGEALGAGMAHIEKYGMQNGKSSEWMRDQARRFTNSVAIDRIQKQMVNDPVGAQQWYRENIGLVDTQHRAQLEHQLKQAVMPIEAKSLAERVIKGGILPAAALATAVSASDALVGAVIKQESGGRQEAVSPKGAIGIMQVMPDTARDVARNMGIPFDPEKLKNDANYNKQLGTRYLNDMLAKYGGNQTLALAAYNAGPGAVDKWLAKYGDPRSGEMSDAEWAAKIPYPETRNYVAKINSQVPGMQGTPATSVDVREHLAQWVADGERMAQTVRPNDPVFRDLVTTQIKSYVSTIAAGYEAQQRKAHGLLVDRLNDYSVQSREQLLDTPERRAAWSMLTPESQRGILAGLQYNMNHAEGKQTKINYKTMQELRERMDLPANDPRLIWKPEQLTPFIEKIGPHNVDWLRKELDKIGSESGKGFNAQVQNAATTAARMLLSSHMGQAFPDRAYEAAHRWRLDVDKQIAAMRESQGKQDVRDLFDPQSKAYILKPEYVKSFMPTATDRTHTGKVDGVKAATPTSAFKPGDIKEFGLGGGKTQKYRFKGGNPNDQSNWEVVK